MSSASYLSGCNSFKTPPCALLGQKISFLYCSIDSRKGKEYFAFLFTLCDNQDDRRCAKKLSVVLNDVLLHKQGILLSDCKMPLTICPSCAIMQTDDICPKYDVA